MGIRAHRAYLDAKTSRAIFFRQVSDAPGNRSSILSHPSREPRWEPYLWTARPCSISRHPGHILRIVAILARQHAPGDARELVSQGCRQHIPVQPGPCRGQPAAEAMAVPVARSLQKHLCPAHEERAQVTVAALGETTQDRAAAGRDLLRHQTVKRHRRSTPASEAQCFGLATQNGIDGVMIGADHDPADAMSSPAKSCIYWQSARGQHSKLIYNAGEEDRSAAGPESAAGAIPGYLRPSKPRKTARETAGLAAGYGGPPR